MVSRAFIVALFLIASSSVAKADAPKAVSVETGNFTCALSSTGKVSCWGDWTKGKDNGHWTPVAIKLPPVVELSVEHFHACARTDVGEVFCWGFTYWGELGNGSDSKPEPTPFRVPGIKGATSMSVGYGHSCAVMKGQVHCWGRGTAGALGDGAGADGLTPVVAKKLKGIIQVEAGSGNTCALTKRGQVYCMGANRQGQVGGRRDLVYTPKKVPVRGVVELSIGDVQICARTKAGQVSCWGYDVATDKTRRRPGRIKAFKSAVGINIGDQSSCAWFADGKARCRGTDDGGFGVGGKLGVEKTVDLTLAGVTDLSVQHDHGCAVAGGEVYCWGKRDDGVLGLGKPTKSDELVNKPTKVTPKWQ